MCFFEKDLNLFTFFELSHIFHSIVVFQFEIERNTEYARLSRGRPGFNSRWESGLRFFP